MLSLCTAGIISLLDQNFQRNSRLERPVVLIKWLWLSMILPTTSKYAGKSNLKHLEWGDFEVFPQYPDIKYYWCVSLSLQCWFSTGGTIIIFNNNRRCDQFGASRGFSCSNNLHCVHTKTQKCRISRNETTTSRKIDVCQENYIPTYQYTLNLHHPCRS